MTEKQFEDFVKRAARDYNIPPDVPREDMWMAIQSARAERQSRGPLLGVFVSPWVRWGIGLAATLALGIGIGMNLDQLTTRRHTETLSTAEAPAEPSARANAYRIAAMEHLGRTEVFLAMFRADVRAGRTDYELANPARELLTTTRLLQGSPASEDTRLRELLDDLELVLVQIAQLRGDEDGVEVDLIAEGIEQREVLLKLRAAAPADPTLRGMQGVI